MAVSPGRYELLHYLLAGLKKTGQLFIEYDGTSISPIFTPRPIGSVDDLGIFAYLPYFTHRFGLNLDFSIELFFVVLVLFSLFISLVGIWLLYRSKWYQISIASVGMISITSFSYLLNQDVYLMYCLPIFITCPGALFFLRKHANSFVFLLFNLLLGFIFGFAHTIRFLSSFGVMIWLIVSIFLLKSKTVSIFRKLFLTSNIVIGFLIPVAFINYQVKKSETYLKNNLSNYKPLEQQHAQWHPLYLGFGFLEFMNPTGIYWGDEFALNQAQEYIPGIDFSDPRYDSIIKEITLNFMYAHPWFVIISLWAKLGAALYFFLRYVQVGILPLVLKLKEFNFFLPFCLGIAPYLFFPLATMPVDVYTLGVITFGYVMSLFSVCDFVGDRKVDTLVRRVIGISFTVLSILNVGVGKLINIFSRFLL